MLIFDLTYIGCLHVSLLFAVEVMSWGIKEDIHGGLDFSDELPSSLSNFRQHMLFYWKSNYRLLSDHSLPPMVNLLFVL